MSAGAGTHGIHCNLSERDESLFVNDYMQRTTTHREANSDIFGASSRTMNFGLTRRTTAASARSRAYDRYQFTVIPSLNFGG